MSELFDEDPYFGRSQKVKDFYNWYEEEFALYESLITTYDIGRSIGILKRAWPHLLLKKGQIKNGIEANDFEIKINFKEINLDEIEKIFQKLDFCGWFISTIDLYQDSQGIKKIQKSINFKTLKTTIDKLQSANNIIIDNIICSLEAKFDLDVDKKKLPKFLYHVTPKEYIPKIGKVGLIPKSQSKSTDHPERIYLAKDKNIIIQLLYPELKRKSEKFNKSPWVIITIDTTTIPNHQRFFEDPNCNYRIYTLASISPYAIEEIKDL